MGYANLANAFAYKEPFYSTKADQLAENDAWLKANNFPDGTKVVFFQASPPTGWTQDTSSNDYALRVVSTVGGGSGGSQSLASTMAINHLHTMTADTDHQHSLQNHSHITSTNSISSYSRLISGGRLVYPGNYKMQWYRIDNAGTPQEIASNATLTSFYDDTGRSSAGAHNHTLGSSLTNTNFAYVDIIVASKNSDSGYYDETGSFSHNAKIIYDTFANLESNDNYLLNRIPVFGSKMIWYQTAPPTGWTQTTTQNDKMLRIVSGAGMGTGGVEPIGTALNLNHTHSINTLGAHTHTIGNHRHDLGIDETRNMYPETHYYGSNGRVYSFKSGGYYYNSDGSAVTRNVLKGRTQQDGNTTSGSSGNHSHTINYTNPSIQPAYIDVIEASKNSTGSPYTFADLTGHILYKKLVTKQKLNAHGQNDEYLKYHTIPSGSKALFYQASPPVTWTLQTTQNDKALRIVSGAGGGSGGSNLLSVGFPLAHTHFIHTSSHGHTFYHTHNFEEESETNAGNIVGPSYGPGPVQADLFFGYLAGSSAFGTSFFIDAITGAFNQANTSSTIYTHDHGGGTQSTLGTIVLRYVDVIMCSKD